MPELLPEPATGLRPNSRELARTILSAFLITFILSRVLVLLIMTRKLPDLFLHLGGTHVHHLNYGIVLLVAVGAWLLLRPPQTLRWPALMYGVGLALTFDEFGMWLHLGGSYWQRASWDAVAIIAASLGLFAYGPAIVNYRPRHWLIGLLLLLAAVLFFYLLAQSFRYAGQRVLPALQQFELDSPR